jgi:predicted transcriptional regulator YdeE
MLLLTILDFLTKRKMENIVVESFNLIGIAIRTSNDKGKGEIDIPQLWGQFFAQNIAAKIPHKIDDNIYCLYTDYESDHTQPYTVLLGYKVPSLAEIPTGLIGKSFERGKYVPFHVVGNLQEGVVFNAWVNIWGMNLPRAYTADFEVYGAKAQNRENAEVDIFIAVK